jgi:tetratricopeptide (TPR) repeat protein
MGITRAKLAYPSPLRINADCFMSATNGVRYNPQTMGLDWEQFERAIHLEESGCIEGALAQFEGLIGTSADPEDNQTLYLNIAKCLRSLKRYSEAKAFITKAYELGTGPAVPYVKFADALIEREVGNLPEASQKLLRLLADFPEVQTDTTYAELRTDVMGELGFVLFQLSEFARARPVLEFVATRDYFKGEVYFSLGACCYELRDFGIAEHYLQLAVSSSGISPSRLIMAHYYLALTYRANRKLLAAKKELKWCLAHDSNDLTGPERIINVLVSVTRELGLLDECVRYENMLKVARYRM